MRVVATETFVHRPSGRHIRRGQVLDGADPVVADTPDWWWRAAVEQATDAPGERRDVKRRGGDC